MPIRSLHPINLVTTAFRSSAASPPATMAAPSSTTTSNIMLAIFEKKTNSVDLYRPLRNFVVFNHSERETQNLEDNLQTLRQLRSEVLRQLRLVVVVWLKLGSVNTMSLLTAKAAAELFQNHYLSTAATIKLETAATTNLVRPTTISPTIHDLKAAANRPPRPPPPPNSKPQPPPIKIQLSL